MTSFMQLDALLAQCLPFSYKYERKLTTSGQTREGFPSPIPAGVLTGDGTVDSAPKRARFSSLERRLQDCCDGRPTRMPGAEVNHGAHGHSDVRMGLAALYLIHHRHDFPRRATAA